MLKVLPRASDIAVVRFRQLMLHSVREFMAGKPALGTEEPRLPLTDIRSAEGLVSKDASWRAMRVTEREIAGYRQLLAARPTPMRKGA